MDRLERQYAGRARVLRLSLASDTGRAAAARYGVRAVPTFIVIDGAGTPVAQSVGIFSSSELRATLDGLLEDTD